MLQSVNTLTVVGARVACIAWGEIRTMKPDGDRVRGSREVQEEEEEEKQRTSRYPPSK